MEALKLLVSLLGQSSHLRQYKEISNFISDEGQIPKSNLNICTVTKVLSDLENRLSKQNRDMRIKEKKLKECYRELEKVKKSWKK